MPIATALDEPAPRTRPFLRDRRIDAYGALLRRVPSINESFHVRTEIDGKFGSNFVHAFGAGLFACRPNGRPRDADVALVAATGRDQLARFLLGRWCRATRYAMVRGAGHPGSKCLLIINVHRETGSRRHGLNGAKAAMGNVTLLEIPTVDVWMRDYGPTFVTRISAERPLAFNDWIFNGWGGKYQAYEKDEGVARAIAQRLQVPVFFHKLVLEGGSIEVNGAGSCLTTEQCLLNPNRNPELSRTQIEEFLKASLGVRHILWLGEGIVGDDTDGHIDDIARFVDPTTVACIIEANPQDDNYRCLQENHERLQSRARPGR